MEKKGLDYMSIRNLLFVLIVLCLSTSNAWAVSVFFNPASQSVVDGNPVSVDLVADLSNPILGWGLGVSFNTAILSLTNVAIGPSWAPGIGFDGDGLAGLAFPAAISGNGIVLATLTFNTLGVGTSTLNAGITPLDLTEGFPLDPTGFDTVSFTAGSIDVTINTQNPIPEPSTILLLGSGLIGLGIWRMRVKNG